MAFTIAMARLIIFCISFKTQAFPDLFSMDLRGASRHEILFVGVPPTTKLGFVQQSKQLIAPAPSTKTWILSYGLTRAGPRAHNQSTNALNF